MFAKNNQFQRERLSTSKGISIRSLGPNAEKVGILHAAKKGFILSYSVLLVQRN